MHSIIEIYQISKITNRINTNKEQVINNLNNAIRLMQSEMTIIMMNKYIDRELQLELQGMQVEDEDSSRVEDCAHVSLLFSLLYSLTTYYLDDSFISIIYIIYIYIIYIYI